jgi:hypothetical protein
MRHISTYIKPEQRLRTPRWPMAAALGCGVLIGLIVFEVIHFWWG